MITILTTKPISYKLLAKPSKNKLFKLQLDGATSPKAINSLLLSQKAKTQPRRKDGRFSKPLPKPSSVENNPLVQFVYHKDGTCLGRHHTVRLISSNDTHFTGLDLVETNKWKYKKFLASKAKNFKVVSFNEQAMS